VVDDDPIVSVHNCSTTHTMRLLHPGSPEKLLIAEWVGTTRPALRLEQILLFHECDTSSPYMSLL
jgi:hypothetical protein